MVAFVLTPPWWGRRDSNPHGLSHMLLRHARLPFRHSPVTQMVLPTPLDSGFRRNDGGYAQRTYA